MCVCVRAWALSSFSIRAYAVRVSNCSWKKEKKEKKNEHAPLLLTPVLLGITVLAHLAVVSHKVLLSAASIKGVQTTMIAKHFEVVSSQNLCETTFKRIA